MNIRETIEKQKGPAAIVSFVILLGAGFFIFRNVAAGPPTLTNQAFFTTDDGQTEFLASADELPPFDHDGKPAYRAWTYTTDGGKTKFVVYLERFTPSAKPRLDAEMADYKAGKLRVPPSAAPGDVEVKKPGAGNNWVKKSDAQEADKIMTVVAPPGEVAEPVMP